MVKQAETDGEPDMDAPDMKKYKKGGMVHGHKHMHKEAHHGHKHMEEGKHHGHKPMHRSMKKPRGA